MSEEQTCLFDLHGHLHLTDSSTALLNNSFMCISDFLFTQVISLLLCWGTSFNLMMPTGWIIGRHSAWCTEWEMEMAKILNVFVFEDAASQRPRSLKTNAEACQHSPTPLQQASCHHQSLHNHAELLNSFGQEDHDADRISLLPEHTFDGYQGDDLSDQECGAMRSEFIGSGSKLYQNYHLGLNDDAPLPPCAEKAHDDWTPYQNWLEFEHANFLFTHAEMPAKKIDMLLDIWATLLLELGGRCSGGESGPGWGSGH
ncbi:hypothetical protein EDD16DRAFT_1525815 [Pisolithus croceorrhizus]|nr:hypothetical protein EDD16DRAFT_1525815 [Pisolithus croceorrhizus]